MTGERSTPLGGPDVTARIPRQRRRELPARARLLVAVGTDKHTFDRLTDWIEQWHRDHGHRVELTLQHGHTRAPATPGAVPFLGHDQLQDAMASADLVVCHGGPATILEARRHGRLPIVVPRNPAHGEHVDDHQLLFARRLGAAGLVALCESREALVAALDAGLADPGRFRVSTDDGSGDARRAAVERVGRIVEQLVASSNRPRRQWWWPRGRVMDGERTR
ncbi:glycosyltransferase [Micromonospora sp. WMMA1923]|uniref:glycosyltransferase n=1 Tax=Micromonospora sp. WMMA1923 TaxID=3404125 RepID=UPI003B92524F